MKTIAKILAIPAVTCWLIRRAQRTPYWHIVKDGVTYMERYWLVNPYDNATRKTKHSWFPLSLRIHHIMQPDQDRDLHDHPWNARTFILHGWYREVREDGAIIRRVAGDTARLNFGEYHRITEVSDGGVWTLFVTGKFQGMWGFKVDGVKVPFREYLAAKGDE
jgi:hypothetical protein